MWHVITMTADEQYDFFNAMNAAILRNLKTTSDLLRAAIRPAVEQSEVQVFAVHDWEARRKRLYLNDAALAFYRSDVGGTKAVDDVAAEVPDNPEDPLALSLLFRTHVYRVVGP